MPRCAHHHRAAKSKVAFSGMGGNHLAEAYPDFMNAIPPIAPLPRDQRNIDMDHLNLLSIFHFVGAGFACLGMLFLMAHFALMHFAFTNPEFWQNQRQPPPPPEFFEMFKVFIWFYLLAGLWLLASAILNILSGIFLRARKYRTFSIVVSGINCVHIPLGTILGIFTIVVLSRESVRELYESVAISGVAGKSR